MPKQKCMHDSAQDRQWKSLSMGFPFVGVLLFSACSSDMRHEFHAPSPEPVSTTEQLIHGTTSMPAPEIGRRVPEVKNPVTVKHLDAKEHPGGRNIYFSDGDATLSEDGQSMLRQHADYLKQNPKLIVVLRAFLDAHGSRTYSLAIVQKRLDNAVRTLQEQGIAKSRIRQIMLGRSSKKTICIPPSCQKMGQRIELLYR